MRHKTPSIIGPSRTLFKKKWIQLHKNGIRGGKPKRREHKELMGMRAFRRRLVCIGKLHSKLVPANVAATITEKHDDGFCNADKRCFSSVPGHPGNPVECSTAFIVRVNKGRKRDSGDANY